MQGQGYKGLSSIDSHACCTFYCQSQDKLRQGVSTRRRVQSRVVSRYICMCKHVSAATVAPLPFLLPVPPFLTCLYAASAAFHQLLFTCSINFSSFYGRSRHRRRLRDRQRKGEREGLRWAKSKLNTRPPKANTTLGDGGVTRTVGKNIAQFKLN